MSWFGSTEENRNNRFGSTEENRCNRLMETGLSEISEVMKPRQRPPIGHGVQSIARVQPLVPEVSMFQPTAQQREQPDHLSEPRLTVRPTSSNDLEQPHRQPLGDLNGQRQQQLRHKQHQLHPRIQAVQSDSEIMMANQWASSSSSAANQKAPPPAPSAAPSVKAALKPTSEFSRVFQETAEPSSLSVLSVFQDPVETTPTGSRGKKMGVSSMPELTSPPPPRPHHGDIRTPAGGSYPTDPDEMYRVLTWQNEQLVKLREQVNRLLSVRETTSSAAGDCSNSSYRQTSSVNSPSRHHQSVNSTSMADSSTQTTPPPTPQKQSAKQFVNQSSSTQRLVNQSPSSATQFVNQSPSSAKRFVVAESNDNGLVVDQIADGISFVRVNNLAVDQPGNQPGNQLDNQLGNQLGNQPNQLGYVVHDNQYSGGSEGRVIGEKILKETEEIQVVPLAEHGGSGGGGEVICKDLLPPEDINQIILDHENRVGGGGNHQVASGNQLIFKENQLTSKGNQLTAAAEPSMIGRLRDMGVSFIKPGDLCVASSSNSQVNGASTSIWHPRAAEPSVLSTTESTSDFSLMLNSAALRYLDDEQLTHVATNKSSNRYSNLAPSLDMTTYGLPENEMSMATKNYLHRNNLSK